MRMLSVSSIDGHGPCDDVPSTKCRFELTRAHTRAVVERIHRASLFSLLAFLLLASGLRGADLAPESMANVVFTTYPKQVTGGTLTPPVTVLLSNTGFQYTVSGFQEGSPLTNPLRYSWRKTDATSGVLSIGATNRIEITFLSAAFGTYRETGFSGATVITGTVYFSSIPQAVAGTAGPLVNVSVRETLAPGQVMTAGFVVGGTVPCRVLVRAVGPSLALFGVTNPMTNPTLGVFRDGIQVASNSGWGGTQGLAEAFSATGAFALPAASRDCAVLITLMPGVYTAQAKGDTGGDVLVEVYVLGQ